MVIIVFSTGLYKCAFFTYSFGKTRSLSFCFGFSVCYYGNNALNKDFLPNTDFKESKNMLVKKISE